MAYLPDKPLSLAAVRREMAEAVEQKNVVLAGMANASYDVPQNIPNSKYSIEKRMLAAAQDEVSLLETLTVSKKAFVVTIESETVDEDTVYTADKTALDICTAVFQGKTVLLFINDSTYLTCDIAFDEYEDDASSVSVTLGWFDSEGTRVTATITDAEEDDGGDGDADNSDDT